ncbi:MAG: YCF48-related protein [Bacteroidota bacterium]
MSPAPGLGNFELRKTDNDWQSFSSLGEFDGTIFSPWNEFHMFNENEGLFFGYLSNSNYALRTFDGGENWEELTNESSFIMGVHNDLDFIQNNLIYVITSDESLEHYYLQKMHPECVVTLKELDELEGNTANDSIYQYYRFDFLNADYGFLSKEDDSGQTRIFKSINGGYDWEMVYGPFNGSVNDVHVQNEDQIFACGKEGLIIQSTDGGNTWSQINIGLADWNAINFKDVQEGYIAGESGNVMRSIDGGLSWQIEESGTTGNILNIDITDLGTIYISGHDFLFKRDPISSLSELNSSENLKIIPNPASDRIVIPGYTPDDNKKWKIIDLNGKTVISGSDAFIDISFLQAGIYLWQARIKEEEVIYKFIKR